MTYLQPDHDWRRQIELFGSSYDTLCDNVASHDAAEYVDHDGVYFGIAGDDLESLLHLVSRGPASNIEKVGWAAPVEFDDVHGGHSQAGTVHHAADISVQSDVVEVVLGWEIWLQATGLGAINTDLRHLPAATSRVSS